ncbi:MAG: monovalent cation/H(+) antiporter subunit G, partial [Phycisphaeraceae bacterium]|nr:monovalent cation/H(+) antiporter subunit G [Phycisphaeraceae bacterium]
WLLIAGMMVQAGLTQVTIKLALMAIFIFFTSPTSTHALARAALATRLKPWTRAGVNSLDVDAANRERLGGPPANPGAGS